MATDWKEETRFVDDDGRVTKVVYSVSSDVLSDRSIMDDLEMEFEVSIWSTEDSTDPSRTCLVVSGFPHSFGVEQAVSRLRHCAVRSVVSVTPHTKENWLFQRESCGSAGTPCFVSVVVPDEDVSVIREVRTQIRSHWEHTFDQKTISIRLTTSASSISRIILVIESKTSIDDALEIMDEIRWLIDQKME